VRLLSKQEVLDLLPVKSQVSLWSWIRDGKFPPSREIGGSVGWIDAEVYAFLANLPQRLPKGSRVTT
jgi:predicted DNA-binding transcriptional regulator AlpA